MKGKRHTSKNDDHKFGLRQWDLMVQLLSMTCFIIIKGKRRTSKNDDHKFRLRQWDLMVQVLSMT
eukprot:6325165-Amphidinium_carterae.1